MPVRNPYLFRNISLLPSLWFLFYFRRNGIELKSSHLLGKCTITCDITPAHFLVYKNRFLYQIADWSKNEIVFGCLL
jgi:hypothetical protein